VFPNKCDTGGQTEIASGRNLGFSTLARSIKVSLSGNERQPEMAAYISETTRDAIEIPTANLRFTTIESSKKVSASDCNIDRQPEIAI